MKNCEVNESVVYSFVFAFLMFLLLPVDFVFNLPQVPGALRLSIIYSGLPSKKNEGLQIIKSTNTMKSLKQE